MIYEKKGNRDAAIGEYRQALRYNPQYAPSQQALVRLTGGANVGGPRDQSERAAAALAEQASQAARRGDYRAAMQALDDAQKLAARYALVYQYRANVAFLMGDKERAKAALKEALAIEPDNALFKTNLERLEKGS